jgi:hypothetical protein
MCKYFYKNAQAACLVFDLTNRKSFEHIIHVWTAQMRQFGHENMYSLLGSVLFLPQPQPVISNVCFICFLVIMYFFRLSGEQIGPPRRTSSDISGGH